MAAFGYNDIVTEDQRYETKKQLCKQRLEDYKNGTYKRGGGLPDKCPEEWYKNNTDCDYKKEWENEKEIKENCEIRINDIIIPFSYFCKFKKKGKYKIK